MHISWLALLIVGALVVGLLVLIVGPIKRFRFGHTTLTCPHCHSETPTHLGVCQNCQTELQGH